ncbi:MAG: 30S ribosomal protein S27e [Thermoplasmatales archaeon]
MPTKLKGIEKSFVKIKCPDCGSETITYSRGSTEVKCLVCGTVLAKPTGGKYLVNGEIVGEFK